MSQEWVIDPSMLVQFYTHEEYSQRVYSLILALDDPMLNFKVHIPEFCLLECANILWKEVAFNRQPLVDVEFAVEHVTSLPLIVYEARPLMKRAFELGVAHHMAIYDMVYLAPAERLQLPLITNDGKQGKIATQLGIPLKMITDFPEYQP